MWPPIDEDGNYKPAYKEYLRDIGVCYDLVAISAELLDKPLKLIAGGPRTGISSASTDGKNIFLPKMHPNRRIATKHELSHIYFKSDAALRSVFVDKLISKYDKGGKLATWSREQLKSDMCFLVNIFDDVRVNSLWGMLFPGDGRDMTDWYYGSVGPDMAAKAKKEVGDDIDHLFTYAILLCLDQDVESTRWGEFKKDILKAKDAVHFTTFEASLVLLKSLVEKIIQKLIEDSEDEDSESSEGNTEPSQESQLSALNQLSQGRKPGDKFEDDNAGFDFNNAVSEAEKRSPDKQATASKLMKVDTEDEDAVDAFVSKESKDAIAAADYLAQAMNLKLQSKGTQYTESDRLRRSVKSEVDIVDIRRKDVRPTILDAEDLFAADRYKTFFRRILGTVENVPSHAGPRLITHKYIQKKITGAPIPCHTSTAPARGFNMTILADMSGSMTGDFGMVEKLVAVLQKAMDFPFVNLRVLGFNSLKKGSVQIYRYPPNTPGLISPKSKVSGITPLSHAIQVAGNSMASCVGDQHLFVLSDGFPVYYLKDKNDAMGTDSLINWTKDAVGELRRRNINTWCFMAGDYTPAPKAMDKMFGHRNWKKIRTSEIYADSFSFITQQFLKHLRNR